MKVITVQDVSVNSYLDLKCGRVYECVCEGEYAMKE